MIARMAFLPRFFNPVVLSSSLPGHGCARATKAFDGAARRNWSARSLSYSCFTPWRPQPYSLVVSGLLSLQPSSEGPSAWLAVAALIGLPLGLWGYKCIMMILFQRKIIYMGNVPLGARNEELDVDVPTPKGLLCEEIRLQSERRVTLYGLDVRRQLRQPVSRFRRVVVVYLQGNAGNPLSRLPVFETLLHRVPLPEKPSDDPYLDISIVAVAPRSYWKSSLRTPKQRGVLADYTAALSYATSQYPSVPIVLYGHSLGGAIAVCLAAKLNATDHAAVKGLILENPFSSIGGMVQALYPQRWLPYRYLAPLAFDKWDAVAAIREMEPQSLLGHILKNTFVLLSGKDEIVPTSMGTDVYTLVLKTLAASQEQSQDPEDIHRKVIIRGALHENAWMDRQWAGEVIAYLKEATEQDEVTRHANAITASVRAR